ncbi:MAG: YceI family protein [Cytophagales bacterium]|nr:YceI family protein [Cytophaga sp.]
MKIKSILIGSLFVAALYSCSSEKPAETTVAVDSTAEVTYTVSTEGSSVLWEGSVIKAHKHFGTLKLTEGTFTLKGTQVVAGTFTTDMKTINPTDSGYNKEHPKEGLVGHLGTAEFFAVDSFPTAKFVIKSFEGNTVTGDLTLRGKTNEEKVTDIVVDTTAGVVKATGKLTVDRQKYGVSYKSAMKDMVLSDELKLEVTLVGNKQ